MPWLFLTRFAGSSLTGSHLAQPGTVLPTRLRELRTERLDFIGIDTPFAHVLNTNHVPTSEERDELQDLIRAPEEQTKKLDEEISRLHARRQCLLLISVCRAWRETALSTPTLWKSIHIYLPVPHWPHDSNGSYISALRDRKEGLKAWLDRSGALPLTISLATDPSYPTSESLTHHLQNVNTAAIPILRTEFTELLGQYSHRWKTVAFGRGVEALDLASFQRLAPNVLTSLESFHGSGMLWDTERSAGFTASRRERYPPLVHILAQAPSLRRLRLAHESISETTLSLPLPWGNLTELSMPSLEPVSISPGRILQILATKCHSLITLSLDIGSSRHPLLHDDRSQAVSSTPVRWPSLQNLRVAFQGLCFRFDGIDLNGDDAAIATLDPIVVETFRSVVSPALSSFSLGLAEYYIPYNSYENGPATFAIDKLPFEDLLQRSQTLTHLELLSPRTFNAEAILRVLRPLEMLVSLNLGHKTLGRRKGAGDGGITFQAPWRRAWLKRILQALLSSASDLEPESQKDAFLVCPRLEELNVGGCSPDEADILIDFAMKKLALTVLRVDFGTVRTPEIGSFLESEEVKVLKEVRSVVLDWKWDEQDSDVKP
ncbi:hypothetical protein PM082_023096 [Marasmius tenuissimus]|nr:hypothetical protein PM082_023096 [Marasmius tenuissimus]